MSEEMISNLNIVSSDILMTPIELKTKFPVSDNQEKKIMESRNTVQNILKGIDKRIFAVVGPCSIHPNLWHTMTSMLTNQNTLTSSSRRVTPEQKP